MTEIELDLDVPEKLEPIFTAPRGSVRYRCAHGGRGSGKSFTFAKMAAVFGAIEPLRILCGREYMNSIKESFHAELKNAIASNAWLESCYDVGIDYIRGKPNTTADGTEFIFRGLRNNISSIKSLAQIDICIIEEAEDVPEHGWVDLEPTIRAPKSEIWAIWNPKKKESAVNVRFRGSNPPPRCLIAEVNYSDNPWFPVELEEQRLHALSTMQPEVYAHVWEGAYLENSDAQIFKGKFEVREFEVTPALGLPFNGLDFGFSRDPTAATQCFVQDQILYVAYECGAVGLDLDDTADFIFKHIPRFIGDTVTADCARPESISYLKKSDPTGQRKHMPKIQPCKKWTGSVEDGVTIMRSFKRIVIHPRCVQTIKEFRLYSYKVDQHGRVTNDIVDAYNHYIDSIRYGIGALIRQKGKGTVMI